MTNQIETIKSAAFLIEKKKYEEAKNILINFQKNNKNLKLDIKFFYTQYLISNSLNEVKNSKKYLEKCLKIDDKNYIILNNLANTFLKEENFDKAETLYLKSFSLKKDYLLVIVNLAILYQNTGKFELSKKFYLRALELAPNRISLYFNLSRIDDKFINEEKIKHISKLLENKKQEASEISYGYFLLANYEKKKENFKEEIKYLENANRYNFESKKYANTKTLNYWNNIINKNYNKFNFINQNKNGILDKLKPIFIIGLPRSGSTITEVILRSNNNKIRSLGEASIFNGVIAKGFENFDNNKIDLEILKNKVYENLENRNFNFKKSFFIDKSLENFFYIDVILKVFPKAVFINTTRNIKDNIFAIYKQSLSKISWTHSIQNILEYIDNYFKVIKYFNQKYPNKIFSLNLEDLTNNSKELSKKIYNFCGLEWSEDILNFDEKQNFLISTASNIQVREKIKEYDINKYKPYKVLLKSFLTKYDWLN